jgi:hypothetical protein
MLADCGDLPQFLIKPDRRRGSERRASGLGGRRSTDELSDLVVLESGRADGWAREIRNLEVRMQNSFSDS